MEPGEVWLLVGRPLPEVGADVERVDHRQDDDHEVISPAPGLGQERGANRDPVGDQEIHDVLLHDLHVHAHIRRARATAGIDQDREAGDEHGERGQGERGAEDRTDPDFLGALRGVPADQDRSDDGDDRDQGLGKGGCHRGEDAAHSPLAQVQAMAEPLDAVREQLGTDEDDRQGGDEDEDFHAEAVRGGGPSARQRVRVGRAGGRSAAAQRGGRA